MNVPDDLVSAYMFANTPYYLAKHIVGSSWFTEVTHLAPEEQLLRLKSLQRLPKTVERAVLGYGLLLALGDGAKHRPEEVVAAGLDAELRWSREIVAFARGRTLHTNRVEFVMPTLAFTPCGHREEGVTTIRALVGQ